MRRNGANAGSRVIRWALAACFFAAGCAQLDAALFQRDGIRWNSDFDQAVAMSKSQNKPMLLRVSTDWCGYCKKMQRETFSDPAIVQRINGNFIPVYVDGDKYKSLVQKLRVRSYPTTVVVAPSQQVLANIKGFRTARQLTADLARFRPAPQQAGTLVATDSTEKAESNAPARQSVFGDNCPVSPIETGKFAKVDPSLATTFRGFSIGFASADYREAFLKNPAKYWPVADGLCVVTAAHGRGQQMGQLNNGALYQGRIWFFADQKTRAAFEAEPKKYLDWFKQQVHRVAKSPNGSGTK